MEIQEFKEKVGQVGAILEMTVEFPSDEDMKWNKFAYLIKEHQKIGIRHGGYQNASKFHIDGDFPRAENGGYSHYGQSPSINVSDSKTPEQIARDIEKRLLPVYLPELEKAIKQVEQANVYDQKRRANIQKMADYFQVEFREDNQGLSIYAHDLIKGLGPRIEVYGENTVKFELELTPERAIEVFNILKQKSL